MDGPTPNRLRFFTLTFGFLPVCPDAIAQAVAQPAVYITQFTCDIARLEVGEPTSGNLVDFNDAFCQTFG